jgi:hypothetical protein
MRTAAPKGGRLGQRADWAQSQCTASHPLPNAFPTRPCRVGARRSITSTPRGP